MWYWLASGLGYGAVNSGELMQACPGGPAEVYNHLGSEHLDAILTQKQAERLASSSPDDFALRAAHCKASGVSILCYDDEAYPATLRTISNPPLILFVKGDTALLNGQLAVGIVGARRPSAYGVEAMRAIGRGVALGGAIIVSGLAAGLDTEAHKAALAVNGPTIACIAFGHDHCYPASNRKLMEVIERYGAVISEYPPDTSPEKAYFLQRNRIIAGFSHGLVVVEARKHSGTMSTVNFAIDYGRDVFGVPGSIFSELSGGTNAMISEGAYVAASARDVLAVYGIDLPGEDPVAAAAKQAAEGKPEPAEADAPWQQNLKRFSEKYYPESISGARHDELPGQQTLGELLRQGGDGGPVNAQQAMETIRSLQRGMGASVDERAAAVSDSVELSPRAKTALPSRDNRDKKEPELFPWHQIEHLERNEIEHLSSSTRKQEPSSSGRKRMPVPSKLHEAPADPKQARPAQWAQPRQEKARTVGRVEPVGRVDAVAPVSPAARVQETEALRETAAYTVEKPKQRPSPPLPKQAERPKPAEMPKQFVPKPVADRDNGRLKQDFGLADRLKTLQKPPTQAKTPPSPPPAITEQYEQPAQQTSTGLSDVAKRALRQLGPEPTDLADICARSGLSSAEAMAALTELELEGLSRQLAGRQFVIADY